MPNPDRYRNTLWRGLATWIGVVTMLTWLSYGHAARRIIATSHLQIGGAPWPAPIANSVPDTTGPIAQAASPPDQQRLKAISLDLDAVRQSVDRIATTQERITRNIDQLTARQEQITGEITKLQEGEQQILHKDSESPLRSAPALARNPMPRSQVPLMR
jgi:septal ring factor EnvC (AmiA/AmiB activator)